jgi:hypothetical protein
VDTGRLIEVLMRNLLTFGRLAGFVVIPAMITACPAQADKIKHPVAVFSGLDKITGRTIAFEAAMGETVQFGTLQITERACYTRPATEAPQTTSFVEVYEIDADKKSKRIFSGWMFAASPGLHGIEHPIYDIWLTDCTGAYAEPAASPDHAEPNVVPPPSQPDTLETPAQDSPPPARKRHPGKTPAPVVQEPAPQEPAAEAPGVEEPMGEAPRERQDAEPPPMGDPIEVAPPPGFIPVPQGHRPPPAPQDQF